MEDINKIDKGYNKKVTKKTQKTNKAVTLESMKNSLSTKGGLVFKCNAFTKCIS